MPHAKPALPEKHPMQDNMAKAAPPIAEIMTSVVERARPLLQAYAHKYKNAVEEAAADPLDIQGAYTEFLRALMTDPAKLAQLQMEYWQGWMNLWQSTAARLRGEEPESEFHPDPGDRRFRSKEWEENLLFDFIKQSYLMTSRWMRHAVHSAEGLDPETLEKLDFATRQFADAMAPTNFVLSNPEVLEETLRTGGENLVRGLRNLLEDMERGGGMPKISTTDTNAFVLGKNIATTPGQVIYRNDLMELIQYAPASTRTGEKAKVFRRPLLIIPPWINKYYILDLRPENSFVKWLVDQGHTVFMISWVNPDEKLSKKRFEDYMTEGAIKALEQIEESTGEPDANVIGYCLGGTLLTATMAVLAERGEANRIASATLLTTLLDFQEAGELKLFTDDRQLQLLDRKMAETGVLDAAHLQRTFSLLRANDLIWSFVINNYLMGKEPFPFDLLYWNDDSTNMPAAMHSFYLRKMYRDNLLIEPGGITMDGTSVDIGKIETPCYFLSTREDHIAPWQATYSGARKLAKAPVTFALAASGHIAGVVNPPAAGKYGFCAVQEEKGKKKQDHIPKSSEIWLKNATEQTGSWWPHWQEWIIPYTNGLVPARVPASTGKQDNLPSAPGTYVKIRNS